MRRLSGFSLMEMMVVLLIVAVVAAASAPMINKKMMSNASERSPWVWTGQNNNVAFNLNDADNTTVTIGAVNPPAGINPSLFIGGDNPVKLALAGDNNEVLGFVTGNGNMTFGNLNGGALDGRQNCTIWGAGATVGGNNSTAIGAGANAGADSVAFGQSARVNGQNSISIGNSDVIGNGSITIGNDSGVTGNNIISIGNATMANINTNNVILIGEEASSLMSNGIAIGNRSEARGENAIAIGNSMGNIRTTASVRSVAIGAEAFTNAENSVAIGAEAEARGINSIAIGHWASTSSEDQIQIGDNSIRYNFSVGSTAILNNGNFVLPSDRRLKNVGKEFNSGLDEIKKLKVFNFTYKKDKTNTPQVGVMAQDLQKIFPNAVTKGDDGYLLIRKEEMFYAMVNAIKELANNFDVQGKKIKELEKQNKELKQQNQEILKRIEALEKKVK